MNIGLIDIILFLSLLYLIFVIILSYSNKQENSNNIIFDDDIIIINSNNTANTNIEKEEDKIKLNFKNKSYFENLENNMNIKTTDVNIKSEMTPKEKSFNYETQQLNDEKEEAIDTYIEDNNRVNDRYNRKLNNVPNENELFDIQQNNSSNYEKVNKKKYDHNKVNKNIDMNIGQDNSLDTKIFNKSNRSQKLFKDSKTIAARFNKNSLIDDYKYELNYYEKAKTPWWESNSKYD
jgi:hypothetical protein